MNEKIKVTINGDGVIDVKTLGIKGKTCDGIVEQILVGVGAKQVESKHTSEFYEDGDNPVEIFSKN